MTDHSAHDTPQLASTDLEGILRGFRRRKWVVLLCVVLVGGSALGFSLTQQKKYSASASLLFRDPALDQKLFGTSFVAPNTDPAREAATNIQLVSLGTVADRAAAALGPGFTSSKVSSEVSIQGAGQSDLVSVTATDPNPQVAARIANTFAEQYIAFRRDADRSKITQAQQLVQGQISQLSPTDQRSQNGQSLKNRAEQLAILAALQTGNAERVQTASAPSSPSSPRTRRNTIIGAVLGLLIGCGLAFLLERLDRRVKSVDELADAYGLPLLGAVPQSRALAQTGSDDSEMPPVVGEAFRMIRAQLRYFNIDEDIRSVLITSPAPRDGKSTVAWSLARTAAMGSKAKVLLIETDLRRPVVARNHGLRAMPGLAEALTHGIAREEVIQHVPIGGADTGTSDFDVIAGGAPPPNPAELLESQKMADLLHELTISYDFVIVDTPPSAVVSDALPLMRLVGGVIIVSNLEQTTRDAAARVRDQLRSLDANVLGVIANRVKRGRTSYYGYEYYGSTRSASREADAPEGNGHLDGATRESMAAVVSRPVGPDAAADEGSSADDEERERRSPLVDPDVVPGRGQRRGWRRSK